MISLPKSVRIEELDPFSAEAQSILLTRINGAAKQESGDTSAVDLTQTSKTAVEHAARFTPFTIYAEYTIERIRDGMHFVGWEDGDLRYPHAYSSNSLFPGSACCLFPCIDDISSRCTWEFSIKCSRTLGDALESTTNGQGGKNANGVNGLKEPHNSASINGFHKDHEMMIDGDDGSRFSDENKTLDLSVICSGDITDEV